MSLFSIFSKKQPPEATSVEEALAGTTSRTSNPSRSRKSAKEDAESVSERKRARRRLIGAIVMVLAVVSGLPLLLDSEPKPIINKNIAIQVASVSEPARDGELVQAESFKVEGDVPASSSKVAPTVPSNPAPVSASVQPPPVTKPTPEAAKKHSDDSARALAILNGVDSLSSSKNTTRVVVQVGAFATQAKVNEVRGKLSAAGIKSYTQKVTTSSGDKIRVRVGPFDNKESAEKTIAQLKKMGINASVITYPL